MRRLPALAAILVLPVSSCVVAESRPALPAPAAQQPPAAPANGPLPAGLYDVTETVLYDTCRPKRNVPPRVSVLKRHENGVPKASIPIQRFGEFARRGNRHDVDLRGFQGSGMSHPKWCPGQQNTYTERFETVSDTSFRVHVEFEVADGWDCPNPRPGPLCKTSMVYEYRLASAACDARCDGFVPNVHDDHVPDGPVAITCSCR